MQCTPPMHAPPPSPVVNVPKKAVIEYTGPGSVKRVFECYLNYGLDASGNPPVFVVPVTDEKKHKKAVK